MFQEEKKTTIESNKNRISSSKLHENGCRNDASPNERLLKSKNGEIECEKRRAQRTIVKLSMRARKGREGKAREIRNQVN